MTDYRFSLDRPTQRFSSIGSAVAPKAVPKTSYKAADPGVLTNVKSPASPSPSTSKVLVNDKLIVTTSMLNARVPLSLTSSLLNLRPVDLWTRDAQYAEFAQIVDYRQENCCSVAGGMRCRTPYMTFQMWNLGVPCDSQSMAKFLFPMDRFVWAQAELRRLLANPPAPIDLTNLVPDSPANENRFIVAHNTIDQNPELWSKWCVQIMRCVALARWSTNIRWDFVTAVSNSTPNMDSLGFFMNRELRLASPVPRSIEEMRSRYHESYSQETIDRDVRSLVQPNEGMTLVGLSPYVWNYNQIGTPVDTGDYMTTERPVRDMPLQPTKVPMSISDFDPVKSWEGSLWSPPLPPSEILEGVRNAPDAEYMLTSYFLSINSIPPNARSRHKWIFQFNAPQYVWDNGARFFWEEGSRRSVQNVEVTATLPSPYVQVLYCAALAQDMVAFDFFAYMSSALDQWLAQYEALPEQFRVLDPNELRSAIRNLQQAQLDAASNTVATAGGAVAAIAAAINPLAGVVVSLLVAIAALLVRLAGELCIVLPEAPPWVAAPFLRFIDTGEDGQGACDFETTDPGGAARIANAHVALIRGMAERGITPADWFTVLDTIEENSPDIRGDGRGRDGLDPESGSLLPLAAAASALFVVLAAVAKKKKETKK